MTICTHAFACLHRRCVRRIAATLLFIKLLFELLQFCHKLLRLQSFGFQPLALRRQFRLFLLPLGFDFRELFLLYRLNRRILLSPCIRISSREEAASVIQRVSFVVSPVCGGVSPPSSSTYHSKSAASLRTAPTPWRRACPLRESCFHRYPHRQYHRLCRTRRSRSGASFPSCPKRLEFPRMNSPFPLIPYFTIFTFVLQYISLKSLKSA